jgi:hypothetical protein
MFQVGATGEEEPYHFHVSKSALREVMLRITALYVEGTGFGTWLRAMTAGKKRGILHQNTPRPVFRPHYFQLSFLIIWMVYYQCG